MWAPTAAAGVRPAHVPWRRNISGHVVQRTESVVFLRQHCKLWRSKLRMQMKRNYAGYLDLSPFILWGDLATKTVEMMLASAQVIGHRTGRMALAGPAPNARDRREFALMGQEKIEAGTQSAQAMACLL